MSKAFYLVTTYPKGAPSWGIDYGQTSTLKKARAWAKTIAASGIRSEIYRRTSQYGVLTLVAEYASTDADPQATQLTAPYLVCIWDGKNFVDSFWDVDSDSAIKNAESWLNYHSKATIQHVTGTHRTETQVLIRVKPQTTQVASKSHASQMFLFPVASKADMFHRAHQIAKEIRDACDSYRAAFALALREVYAQMRESQLQAA